MTILTYFVKIQIKYMRSPLSRKIYFKASHDFTVIVLPEICYLKDIINTIKTIK